jgi:hypothetical protein
MAEEKNNGFILISFNIGKNLEGFELLFRIIEVVVELPLPEFPEKYWKFRDVFLEEEANQLADYFLMYYIINTGDTIFSYKFIYKLSETELKILREYLNENLEREYI